MQRDKARGTHGIASELVAFVLEYDLPLQQAAASAATIPHAPAPTSRQALHSLRHTFGTALFKRSEHAKIVQSLLGHASIVQTMDTYAHLLEDIGGNAVGGLDEAFGRVRLGTSIMDALFPVPVILARRFATLDRLSGGRLIAGLGQGYSPEEFAAANVPMSRRGAGFEAMRTAWGPDPVHFSGRFYEIPESQINPKPVQEGGPPMLIAAMQKPAVERAGRLGFGLNPLAPSWEALEAAVGAFRKRRTPRATTLRPW